MAGGGVGEAMLIGAAVGAGTGGIMSAVQDKDPLEGALLGAAMGAAGGGIGSAVGGAASGAATGATGGAAGGTTGGVTGGTAGGIEGGVAGGTAGTGSAVGSGLSTGGADILATGGVQGATTGVTTGGAASAPTSWGAQGLGQGFAPALTNAQAYGAGAGGGIMGLIGNSQNQGEQWAPEQQPYTGSLSYFKYNPQTFRPSNAPGYADGGIASIGPQSGMFPQSQIPDRTQFSVPTQIPTSREVIGSDYDARINPYTGDMMMASGGISSLGSYSDGGRMLRGPGDGMSDDIPGVIAGKQPARLADGEFVVPADVVSHLGNGSTDAGAKKLYSMMDNVRKARTGSKKQGKQIKADKYMPEMASGGTVERFASGNLVVNPETNEVGYWNQNGDNYWDQEWVPISTSQNPTGVGATSATQFSGSAYDPNYYNLGYYKDQLPGAQSAVDAFAGQKSFDPNYYLTQYPDLAADRYWSKNPLQHYQEHGIQEGRSPYEGGQAGVQLLDTNAQQAAQQTLQNIQSNVNRLEGSSIKYDPYTIASRPSSAEPQFYGNIYRPQYPDYSTPGYTLTGGNLGEWSNVAGEAQRAAQPASMAQNITQDYLQTLGRAPDTAGFNYWMQSNAPAADIAKSIQASNEAKQVEAPKEEKKRKGGIASLRRSA